MAQPRPEFPFTIRFSAGEAIDATAGTLSTVSVAEIGEATGHFVALDREGAIIGVDDYEIARTAKRIPLFMDEKGIEMVVAAGQAAGRVKAREDHDDSIGARAGFMSNFRLVDGKAVCDATVFDSYRNRATFFETATKTPEMIGLSGDFTFVAEVIGDKAFMRVTRIDAVDIVDRGALTHAGLFRALTPIPVVDKTKKATARKFSKASTMANAPKVPPAAPDLPDMDAFKAMCEMVGAYSAAVSTSNSDFASKLTEAMAAITPVNVPTPDGAPAPVTGAPTDADASVKDPVAAFKALEARLEAKIASSQTTVAKAVAGEMQRQFSALGIKPAAAPTPTPDLAPVAPVMSDEPKTFLALKAKIQKERSLKPGAAAQAAMKEKPELFREYQRGLGIYDQSKDPRNRAVAVA